MKTITFFTFIRPDIFVIMICLILISSSVTFGQNWVNPNPKKYSTQKEHEEREFLVKENNRKLAQVRNLYSEEEMNTEFYIYFRYVFADLIGKNCGNDLSCEMEVFNNVSSLLDFMISEHSLPQNKWDLLTYFKSNNLKEYILKCRILSYVSKCESVLYALQHQTEYFDNRGIAIMSTHSGTYYETFVKSFSEKEKIIFLKSLYFMFAYNTVIYKKYGELNNDKIFALLQKNLNDTTVIEKNYIFLTEEVESERLIQLLEIINPDAYNNLKSMQSETEKFIEGKALIKFKYGTKIVLNKTSNEFETIKVKKIKYLSEKPTEEIQKVLQNNIDLENGKYEINYTVGLLNYPDPYCVYTAKKVN